jgi:uncharacterized delta-60 repeat protein
METNNMSRQRRTMHSFGAAITAAIFISTGAGAVCTAGAVDTTFGAASTGGFVQSAPVFVNGNDSGNAGMVITSSDNGIVTNSLMGMDSSGNAILGLAKFKRGGTLDTTFGGFGIVSPGGPAAADAGTISALTQDSAGNLIEVQFDAGAVVVTRYTASGTLDTSFGTSGSASVALPNLAGGLSDAVTLPDGSVLVTGSATNPAAPNPLQPFAVKFTSTGALDPTFGTGGITYFYPASLTNPASQGIGTAIAALPTGQIIVAGRVRVDGSHRVSFVARLQADGSLDTTFGTGGFTLVDLSPAYPFAQGRKVAVQPDGKIVVVGNGFDSSGIFFVFLFQLLPGGALDAGFGSGGTTVLTSPFGIGGFTIALQNNGKILLGASIFNDPAALTGTASVVRFTSVGTLDTTFGIGGYANVMPPGWSNTGPGEVAYSGSKIVFRIQAAQGSQNTEFLVRLDSGTGAGCH